MLDSKSTMDLSNSNAAEEARERRWENTFFMLNVIFLLILFFIVAANFDVQLQIFPPKSSAMGELPPDAMQLTVNEEGVLYLNGEVIDRKELTREIKALGKGAELKLAADAKLEAVKVAEIIQEVSAAGIVKLVIVTLSRTDEDQIGK
ncbi:MAG: ExbD/TolR family protein [Gammaproteobacteria bacterium]